jgi:hypothetical protein
MRNIVQVSGMRYAYDANATVGERIVSAVLAGSSNQSIAELPEVIVVMTNYMASGADG